MIYLELFITFFQIGLFGFGGGYGILSLIQTETVVQHQWLTTAEFTNIVAISQMTPGPVGINTATYCGYAAAEKAGFGDAMAVLGSFTATFALVLPSVILMILISKMFMKYMDTPVMQSIFTALRPVVVGLLAAATLLLMNADNFKTIVIPGYAYSRCDSPVTVNAKGYTVLNVYYDLSEAYTSSGQTHILTSPKSLPVPLPRGAGGNDREWRR